LAVLLPLTRAGIARAKQRAGRYYGVDRNLFLTHFLTHFDFDGQKISVK
jgi:hypothetical protein